jgi:hypothetical protein
MQKKVFIGFVFMIMCTLQLKAQYAKTESTYKKRFVGSTLFLLGNFDSVNPPGFAQLNLGYRITGKDVISLELITWKHAWPLGINPFYNDSYGKPEDKFPGYIREYGIGLAYQRYLWKGLYVAVHAMPMWQTFKNENSHIRWTMGLLYSTRIELVITLNSLKISFLLNHHSVLLVVHITPKCQMDLKKKIISGQNGPLNLGFILGIISN